MRAIIFLLVGIVACGEPGTDNLNMTESADSSVQASGEALVCECTDGSMGPAGSDGDDGAPGIDGYNGSDGEQGDVGPAGPTGNPGAAGPTGAMGLMGLVGPAGMTGATGAQGATGSQGPRGTQGTIGPQGPDGDIGIQGIQGATGEQGLEGMAGLDGVFTAGALYQSQVGIQMPDADKGQIVTVFCRSMSDIIINAGCRSYLIVNGVARPAYPPENIATLTDSFHINAYTWSCRWWTNVGNLVLRAYVTCLALP